LLRFLTGLAMLALAFTAPTLNQAAVSAPPVGASALNPVAASAPPVGASALNPVAEGASTAARLPVPIDTDISEKSEKVLSEVRGIRGEGRLGQAGENPARATAGAPSAAAARALHTQLEIAVTARTSTDISEKSGNVVQSQATTLALAGVALRITAQRAPPAI
jgi:hypothetical protein